MEGNLRIAPGDVKFMRRPSIMVTIVIIHSNGPRLAVSRRLRATPMLRRIYSECTEQEQ
jgi:hypothetical protein